MAPPCGVDALQSPVFQNTHKTNTHNKKNANVRNNNNTYNTRSGGLFCTQERIDGMLSQKHYARPKDAFAEWNVESGMTSSCAKVLKARVVKGKGCSVNVDSLEGFSSVVKPETCWRSN